jgi:hypothetical protein
MRIVYVSYLHPVIAPGCERELAYALDEATARQGREAYFLAALGQARSAHTSR